MHPELEDRLLALSTEPYRATGRFNYYWARGKLRGDPIFPAMLDHAILPDDAHVIDLGCGRGLLASWMLGAERLATQGEWYSDRDPPMGLHFTGVELMAREAACGNRALRPLYGERVHLNAGDMRDASFDDANVVVILDVLHYIPYPEQDRLLDKIRSGLGRTGLLVTRIGDADAGLRFAFSRLVDRCVSFSQGHRLPRMWCRSRDEWTDTLKQRGFAVQTIPMSAGTLFANFMLIARVT